MEAFEEHLQYELDMFFVTDHALKVTVAVLTPPIRYGLVEVFCIHARNLIEFFGQLSETPGHARSDYMGARHFCDGAYVPWRGKPPAQKLVGKLSRHVSHLTYDRTKAVSEKIGVEAREELFGLLKSETANFGRHLREPYRSRWRYGNIEIMDGLQLVSTATAAIMSIETKW
jgi:hypothetical protein